MIYFVVAKMFPVGKNIKNDFTFYQHPYGFFSWWYLPFLSRNAWYFYQVKRFYESLKHIVNIIDFMEESMVGYYEHSAVI